MELCRDEPLTGLEVGKRYRVSGQLKVGYYRRPLAVFRHPPETLEQGGCRDERVVRSPLANRRRSGSGGRRVLLRSSLV